MAADPYKYFRIEAREILDDVGRSVLQLERQQASPALTARLLRQAHTLKGAARVVRQREIADRAHEIEDALLPLRDDPETPVSRAQIDRVLGLLDRISALLAILNLPTPNGDGTPAAGGPAAGVAPAASVVSPAVLPAAAPAPPVSDTPASAAMTPPAAGPRPARDAASPSADPARTPDQPAKRAPVAAAVAASISVAAPISVPVSPAAAGAEQVRLIRSDVEEIEAITDGLIEVGVQLAGVRRGAAGIDRLRQLAETLHAELGGGHAGGVATADPTTRRVRGLSEELGDVAATLARVFGDGTAQIERELRQVRDVVERLRLVPASVLFAALERSARDAAVSVGKAVDFVTTGGRLRLEAETVGSLQGAMIQAIRNAVAHGIESEGERRVQGKPPRGTITVAIEGRGSRVAFRCQDDGRGIDLVAVRHVVESRQGATRATSLSDDELLQQLLQGGITTAAGASLVSGRGIGLDVVRETAARLRGDVRIETNPGRGTSVEIVVPVSSAALDVLLVEAAGQSVAIPLDGVRETRRLQTSDVAHSGEGESIVYAGQAIPFLPLERCLATKGKTGVARLPGAAWSAVVVASGGAMVALGVDRLRGTDGVVFRALPDHVAADPTVAGAALDGEGNPRVVLDPAGLVAAARAQQPVTVAAPVERPPILIIDDSLTTRMLEQSILESAGYEVELATCAEEGFEKAHQRAYGLFLVDVEMPGMDGFTFVERSRADRALGHIPAILVTSRSSPEDRRRGELVGASDYIVKGEFDQNALLGRIKELVG